MAVINSDNKSAWQDLANAAGDQRPDPGKRVRVQKGKHGGKEGVVEVHQVDKFMDPFRYASEAQAMLREMNGRWGYVVLVRPDSGDKFWVKADNVEVLRAKV